MPSQVQLDHYYNSDMKTFENDFFNDSFEQRIPIFNYRIQRIGDYLPQGRLLDVGSAIGIFVEAMMRSNLILGSNAASLVAMPLSVCLNVTHLCLCMSVGYRIWRPKNNMMRSACGIL